MNYGMRCHDICPKADMDTVFDAVRDLGIHQIQLAFGKSIAGLDFSYGHYSPGLGRMVAEKLREREIHVAVLVCYINPTPPDEAKRQTEVQKFIEHLKYAKAIGADMVGTETGRYDANFRVVPETRTEECYRLLLKSMREIVAAAEKLGVPVFEYTPMQVKQAVAGYGGADKRQVMLMTQRLLNMKEIPRPDDAADALAIAICHSRAATSLLNTERVFDPKKYDTR